VVHGTKLNQTLSDPAISQLDTMVSRSDALEQRREAKCRAPNNPHHLERKGRTQSYFRFVVSNPTAVMNNIAA